MTYLIDELANHIKELVGRFNTDVLSGWEAGLKGKQRLCGKLRDRHPPNHVLGTRMDDWYAGRDAAIKYKSNTRRETHFYSGSMLVKRKGWNSKRGTVISQMEKNGAYGDVHVFYLENGKVVREILCGI